MSPVNSPGTVMHHHMAEISAWQSQAQFAPSLLRLILSPFWAPVSPSGYESLDWIVFLWPDQLWQPEFTFLCTVCFHDISRKKLISTKCPLTLALSLRGFPRIPYNVVEEKRCFLQPSKCHPQPYLLAFGHTVPSVLPCACQGWNPMPGFMTKLSLTTLWSSWAPGNVPSDYFV